MEWKKREVDLDCGDCQGEGNVEIFLTFRELLEADGFRVVRMRWTGSGLGEDVRKYYARTIFSSLRSGDC